MNRKKVRNQTSSKLQAHLVFLGRRRRRGGVSAASESKYGAAGGRETWQIKMDGPTRVAHEKAVTERR